MREPNPMRPRKEAIWDPDKGCWHLYYIWNSKHMIWFDEFAQDYLEHLTEDPNDKPLWEAKLESRPLLRLREGYAWHGKVNDWGRLVNNEEGFIICGGDFATVSPYPLARWKNGAYQAGHLWYLPSIDPSQPWVLYDQSDKKVIRKYDKNLKFNGTLHGQKDKNNE